jgi:hypothetical protein
MKMIKYEVICIPLVHDNPTELENKVAEVERYFYGRFFLLAFAPPEEIGRKTVARVYWLVERHYGQHIIDRLASGLFAARRATLEETDQLLEKGEGSAVIEHTIRLEQWMGASAWAWACSCGAQSKRTWDSKYAAGHAGQNHAIRERQKEKI